MNFEGLQGLLKKKKPQQLQPPSPSPPALSTPAASAAAPTPLSSVSTGSASGAVCQPTKPAPAGAVDPYAAAIGRVQALQQQQQQHQEDAKAAKVEPDEALNCSSRVTLGQKRARDEADALPREADDIVASESSPAVQRTSTEADTSSAAPGDEGGTLKGDSEVTAQREKALAALQMSIAQLENAWAAERAAAKGPARGVAPQPTPSAPAPAAGVALTSRTLPRALRRYLTSQFVSSSAASASRTTGVPEMSVVDREFELLAQLWTELGPDGAEADGDDGATTGAGAVAAASSTAGGSDEESPQQQLASLARALWYLIAVRWQYSLDPHHGRGVATPVCPRDGPRVSSGWTPVLYLALSSALPAEVRLEHGRAVADEVERWRGLARTRQDALELLAYVCADYDTCAAAAEATKTRSAADTVDGCIIPAELRASLHVMLVHHLQQERQFMAARQDYVDMTMGTANWKLGLFSGGEVHMRRSMERVERNRIAHLLNNEHATQLLQSVRELTTFIEQQGVARHPLFFFVSP